MKMNPKLRRILLISVWVLSGLGVCTLLGFVNQRAEEMPCKGIEVNIQDADEHEFIEEQELLNLVNMHHVLTGKPLGSINTSLLEKTILTNPYVGTAEVYSSIDGNLHVDVSQRNPLVRIINMHDEQFYIDTKGQFMPVSARYTPRALVANGYIFNGYTELKVDQTPVKLEEESKDSTSVEVPRIINQVFALAKFIEADSFWAANAEQIYVNEKQELELIPRVGNHRILIGDTTELSDKFRRLMVFYTEGLSKTGWNSYSTINLKFRNQVVCNKKSN